MSIAKSYVANGVVGHEDSVSTIGLVTRVCRDKSEAPHGRRQRTAGKSTEVMTIDYRYRELIQLEEEAEMHGS